MKKEDYDFIVNCSKNMNFKSMDKKYKVEDRIIIKKIISDACKNVLKKKREERNERK